MGPTAPDIFQYSRNIPETNIPEGFLKILENPEKF
jgi:hypothetical protein